MAAYFTKQTLESLILNSSTKPEMFIASCRFEAYAAYVEGLFAGAQREDLECFGLWLNVQLDLNATNIGWPALLLELACGADWTALEGMPLETHRAAVQEAGSLIHRYLDRRRHVGDAGIRAEYAGHALRNRARFEDEARCLVEAAGFGKPDS